MPEFESRLALLREIGYVDREDTVTLRGRVACEMNAADEVLLTDMIFDSQLSALEPEEVVAVLSSLVFREKTESKPNLNVACETAMAKMTEMATKFGEVGESKYRTRLFVYLLLFLA